MNKMRHPAAFFTFWNSVRWFAFVFGVLIGPEPSC